LAGQSEIFLAGRIAWFSFLGSCECGFVGFCEADGTGHASILSCELRIVFLQQDSDGNKVQLYEAFAHGMCKQDLDVGLGKLLGEITKKLG
jgi:hypothetical protein